MARWLSSRFVWGGILVLGGIALLLQNLDIFPGVGSWFWAIIFILGGGALLSIYYDNRDNWWAFIPAFTLFGLGASSFLEAFNLSIFNALSGSVFFLGISLGFILVFVVDRQQWWAIIPAGVLLTLGAVTFIDNGNLKIDSGAVFFLGMGLTFAILALIPGYETMLRWAFIPAGILIVIGLLISATSENLINLVFPSILIVGGVLLVFRSMLDKKSGR